MEPVKPIFAGHTERMIARIIKISGTDTNAADYHQVFRKVLSFLSGEYHGRAGLIVRNYGKFSIAAEIHVFARETGNGN